MITKDETTIVEGSGDEADIKGRINQIKAEIENTDSDYDREKLQERLAKLSGGVAVIKVGAATEVELKEKKHRIEDAVSTTKAAIEEGVVPGGGVALLRAQAAIWETADKLEGDEATGARIVGRAVEEPLKQIAVNAGLEGGVVVEKVRNLKKPTEGLNAATGEYEDLLEGRRHRRGEGDALRAAERGVDRGAVPHDRGRHRRQARGQGAGDAGRRDGRLLGAPPAGATPLVAWRTAAGPSPVAVSRSGVGRGAPGVGRTQATWPAGVDPLGTRSTTAESEGHGRHRQRQAPDGAPWGGAYHCQVSTAPDPLVPTTGLTVLHLFCKTGFDVDRPAVAEAVGWASAAGCQVVTTAILGHKADVCVMALAADAWTLRELQSRLRRSGLDVVDSYLSMTEVSEYATGMPAELLEARLHPVLPPEGLRAFCFYPMSKRRGDRHNWYDLDYARREELMRGHGKVGREFKGRILQVVTGSTGLDDFEWGVTLFGAHLDDLKDCVYTMRFDEASADYAEFGPFYAGVVASLDELYDLAVG